MLKSVAKQFIENLWIELTSDNCKPGEWKCSGPTKTFAKKVARNMGISFEDGGHACCDCKIVFNSPFLDTEDF